MTKQQVREMFEDLSEETAPAAFEEIAGAIEKVRFMASVQKGLDQLDRGEGIPHSEVKKKIAQWLER